MPTVRLAGTVRGEKDPNREIRARLLYSLFSQGWDIYNSNGDQRITLANIETKIVEAGAFVFTPGATLEDVFKAVSVFVGYQTLDPYLQDKPTVLLNSDGTWDPFLRLLDHLHQLGTIKQRHRDFLLTACSAEETLSVLEDRRGGDILTTSAERPDLGASASYDTCPPAGHRGNVCVFCSASITDSGYLADGYEFGRRLADSRFGCVSGAGNSGIMGEVVRGAVEAGGWAGGSNVPHIIELEGLPHGLSSFWLKPDIYTRMEVMIDRSDAFVIFPGGAGTVQEMLALMILKHQGHPAALRKPVVVYNRHDGAGRAFWSPMIELVRPWCVNGEFVVVDRFEDLLPEVERMLVAAKA